MRLTRALTAGLGRFKLAGAVASESGGFKFKLDARIHSESVADNGQLGRLTRIS